MLPISVTSWALPLALARTGASDVKHAQERPELAAELRARQRQLHRRLKPAHRGAGVEPAPLECVSEDALLVHQGVDRVGQLDLAAGAALGLLKLVEDLGREHVT